MGKIVVSDNIPVDGVIQDPAGDEGFRVGGWAGLPGAACAVGFPSKARLLQKPPLGT